MPNKPKGWRGRMPKIFPNPFPSKSMFVKLTIQAIIAQSRSTSALSRQAESPLYKAKPIAPITT